MRSCLADRVAHGRQFDELCRSLGLAPEDTAQLLHVSLRTVHNWRAGVYPVPYMAFKLVRVLRFLELPFAGWEGWCFVGGKLVSPEGRSFVGRDSAWWNHLVRRAELFDVLHSERGHLMAIIASLRDEVDALRQAAMAGGAAAAMAPGNREVPVTLHKRLTGEPAARYLGTSGGLQ